MWNILIHALSFWIYFYLRWKFSIKSSSNQLWQLMSLNTVVLLLMILCCSGKRNNVMQFAQECAQFVFDINLHSLWYKIIENLDECKIEKFNAMISWIELFRLRSFAINLMFCTINCERIESEIENWYSFCHV